MMEMRRIKQLLLLASKYTHYVLIGIITIDRMSPLKKDNMLSRQYQTMMNSSDDNSCNTYDPVEHLPIPAYNKWESDIVWDNDTSEEGPRSAVDDALTDTYSYRSDDSSRWKRLITGTDDVVSRKLRRVILSGNSHMASGEWVRGIVWGNGSIVSVGGKGKRGREYDLMNHMLDSDEEEESYGDLIPLVNTAEESEEYLPLPPKPPSAQATVEAAREAEAAAQAIADAMSVPQKPTEIVKGPLYRQMKAREKKERLDKLKAHSMAIITGGAVATGSGGVLTDKTIGGIGAASALDVSTTTANARRRRATTAELEHCIVAARHMNCRPHLFKLELKFFHR